MLGREKCPAHVVHDDLCASQYIGPAFSLNDIGNISKYVFRHRSLYINQSTPRVAFQMACNVFIHPGRNECVTGGLSHPAQG